MGKPVSLLGVLTFAIVAGGPATAQIADYPTPPPAVTAESEDWYAAGGPIAFGGIVYYPSGPVRHFDRNEMVQAGQFEGIPVYIKTTREPRSVIFVPLTGGLVRPYEQRRSGDLAGTTGSVPPRYPVVLPAEERREIGGRMPRAAAPPTGVPVSAFGTQSAAPADAMGRGEAPATTRAEEEAPEFLPDVPRHVRIGPRPTGLNGIFVEFAERRWFAAGSAVPLEPAFRQVGEYAGFPVFAAGDRPDVIYLPVVSGNQGLVTPYAAR